MLLQNMAMLEARGKEIEETGVEELGFCVKELQRSRF